MVSLPPLPSLDLKVTETVSPAGGGTHGEGTPRGSLGSLPGLPALIDPVWGSPLPDGATRADCQRNPVKRVARGHCACVATAPLGRVTSPLAR